MPLFAALLRLLQVSGSGPAGGAQPAATFPWWYGLAGLAIAALIIWFLLKYSDDSPRELNYTLFTLAGLVLIGTGMTIVYPLARQKGIEVARQMPSITTPADSATVAARVAANPNAILEQNREATRNWVLLALMVGALVFFFLFVREANRGNMMLTSHWGGFGGGLGGWQVPSSLLYMVIAIFFVVMLAMMAPHDVLPPVSIAKEQTPSAHDSTADKTKSDSAAAAAK